MIETKYFAHTENKSGKILKEFVVEGNDLDISKKKLTGILKTNIDGKLNCSNNKLKQIVANECKEINCENNELTEIFAHSLEVLNCEGNTDLFVLKNMYNLKTLNGKNIK